MSDALPALIPGRITSVIAPRGIPPSIDSSRKRKPVIKRLAGVHEGWGKRSASRLRRSIILAPAAMRGKHGAFEEHVQVNIQAGLPAFLNVFSVALACGSVTPSRPGP